MICSSWPVPSVATTSACVSPRVNSAEPCARGSTPTSHDDRPHGLGVAAVDARLAFDDGAAHDLLLELLEELAGERALRLVGEERGDLGLGGVELVAARLLLLLGIGRRELGR